jgi:hypothetical protein
VPTVTHLLEDRLRMLFLISGDMTRMSLIGTGRVISRIWSVIRFSVPLSSSGHERQYAPVGVGADADAVGVES